MSRASTAISLCIIGSVVAAWSYEIDRREQYYAANPNAYPTTRYYNGGHYYGNHYYNYPHPPGWFSTGWGGGGGWSAGSSGYSSVSSGISRGGFGATGHSMGGHA